MGKLGNAPHLCLSKVLNIAFDNRRPVKTRSRQKRATDDSVLCTKVALWSKTIDLGKELRTTLMVLRDLVPLKTLPLHRRWAPPVLPKPCLPPRLADVWLEAGHRHLPPPAPACAEVGSPRP